MLLPRRCGGGPPHRLRQGTVRAAVHLNQEDPRAFAAWKACSRGPQPEAGAHLAHDQLDACARVGDGHQPAYSLGSIQPAFVDEVFPPVMSSW